MATKAKKTVKTGKTLVNFILDKSGSMSSVLDATISGFNEYVNSLKSDKKSKYEFSLTLFDTETTKTHVGIDIKDVKDLNKESYAPNGGTALYDAVCKTIKDLKDTKATKVVTIIMTDGQENSSREYTQVHMRDLIKECEAKGNWTFVYLGANQDSYAVAAQYGMAMGNTVNFTASAAGTKVAFSAMAASTRSYAASKNVETCNFIQEVDRKQVEETK